MTITEYLTITTLNGKTFLKMKNDLSFIINFELNPYDHQLQFFVSKERKDKNSIMLNTVNSISFHSIC